MTGGRQPLVLLAASGLAREVIASVFLADRFDVVGVLDDDPARHGRPFGRTSVVGASGDAIGFSDALFVVCAGRGAVRERIVVKLAEIGIGTDRYATIFDPTAVVPPGCTIGAGSILLSHVSLTADVTIGRHVVIMPQAVLTHDNRIDDFATVCAGAALGGSVHVGRGAYLGMNTSVRQDLRVGQYATLGMGSALIHDLPDGRTWAGVPARDLADRRSERSTHQLNNCETASGAVGSEGILLP